MGKKLKVQDSKTGTWSKDSAYSGKTAQTSKDSTYQSKGASGKRNALPDSARGGSSGHSSSRGGSEHHDSKNKAVSFDLFRSYGGRDKGVVDLSNRVIRRGDTINSKGKGADGITGSSSSSSKGQGKN